VRILVVATVFSDGESVGKKRQILIKLYTYALKSVGKTQMFCPMAEIPSL